MRTRLKVILAVVVVGCAAMAAGIGVTRSSRRAPEPLMPTPGPGVRFDQDLAAHFQYVQFDSAALRSNLIGDPHRREYGVLLPPSYFADTTRRYPVVYLFHGLGPRRDGHLGLSSVQRAAFRQMQADRLPEMLLVSVDGTTIFGGSYYASSPTIGDFEGYVVDEIIPAVDGAFRTLATRANRGVAGFSMGGHGALKLAMKKPEVFSAVGSLSGSPMSIRYRRNIYRDALAKKRRPGSLAELLALYPYDSHWSTAAAFAKAAAFSPNPKKPPLFLELPFEQPAGGGDDRIWQRWWDDDPLSLVAANHRGLKGLKLLYLDHGDEETALGTEDFVRELVRYGVGHVHHIFQGDHADHFIERHVRMLKVLSVAWNLDE